MRHSQKLFLVSTNIKEENYLMLMLSKQAVTKSSIACKVECLRQNPNCVGVIILLRCRKGKSLLSITLSKIFEIKVWRM